MLKTVDLLGYIFMGIIAALLNGCSQTSVSILDLTCDSECENLYITISIPEGGIVTTAFNTTKKEWIHLTSVEGVKFSYLSGDASNDLVATNGNEILLVNIKDGSYRTLYKHTASVFYPTKTEDCLYFSESTTKAHGARNQDQGRILWKFDTAKGELLQGLRPWTAYQIGRPFIVNNEWLYLDFILPSKALDNNIKSSEPDLPGALNDQSAYKLNLKSAFGVQVSQELLINGRLFGGQKRAEQISIDKNGDYIAFYSLSSTPSHWIVQDMRSNEPVVSIDSNGNDRLVISPAGSKYAYVAGHNGYINVSIGDLPNRKPVIDLSLSTKNIKQTIFERKEK